MVVMTTLMPFLLAGVLSLVIARISGCRSTRNLQFDVFCDNRCAAGVVYAVITFSPAPATPTLINSSLSGDWSGGCHSKPALRIICASSSMKVSEILVYSRSI